MEPYEHDQLADPREQIRLLQITPADKTAPVSIDIKTYNREEAPAYAALSYTWGDHRLSKQIAANGNLLNVTENCWYALGQLRLARISEYYWIDAVCINQSNDVEKSAQVNLMGEIYRNSKCAAVSLGRHDRATSYLYRIMTSCGFHEEETSPMLQELVQAMLNSLDDPAQDRLWQGLCALGSRSYWKRLWIVQEFALPPKVLLLCGNGCLDSEAVYALRTELRITSSQDNQEIRRPTRYDNSLIENLGLTPTSDLRSLVQWCGAGLAELEEVVKSLGTRQCIDPRDRIFAILSLIKWPKGSPRLEADYSLTCPELVSKVSRLYDEPLRPRIANIRQNLQLLDIGPDDLVMWEMWERRRKLEWSDKYRGHSSLVQSGKVKCDRQRSSIWIVPENDFIVRLSDWWVYFLVRGPVKQQKTSKLISRRCIVPSAARPGDIVVQFWLLLHAHQFLILRPLEGDIFAILGNALVCDVEVTPQSEPKYLPRPSPWASMEFHLDHDDLVFLIWQLGDKDDSAEAFTECPPTSVMERLATFFSDGKLSSFANVSWGPKAQVLGTIRERVEVGDQEL